MLKTAHGAVLLAWFAFIFILAFALMWRGATWLAEHWGSLKERAMERARQRAYKEQQQGKPEKPEKPKAQQPEPAPSGA